MLPSLSPDFLLSASFFWFAEAAARAIPRRGVSSGCSKSMNYLILNLVNYSVFVLPKMPLLFEFFVVHLIFSKIYVHRKLQMSIKVY